MAIQDDNTILNKGDLKAYHEAIAPMLGGTLLSRTNVSDHYSTDEKIVGVWTDGKPLYSKTLTGSTSVAGDAWSDTGIVTPSNIVLIELLPIRYLDGSQFQTIPCIGYISNNHLQVFNIRKNDYQVSTIYATIYYTKTTDAAGSATTTPGAYDINFPNTWKENTEIYFGNGVYGKRYTGTATASATVADTVIDTTITNTVNPQLTGGFFQRGNGAKFPIQTTMNHADVEGYLEFNSSGLLFTTKTTSSESWSYDIWITYTK